MTLPLKVGRNERWVTGAGGAALMGYGVARRGWLGWTLAGVGAGLAWRAASGSCAFRTAQQRQAPTRVDHTVSVHKAPDEVYEFWSRLENLPRFMENLESVTPAGGNRSHWVAKGPAGTSVEWDAEIVNARPGRLIEWRSLPGSSVESRGTVRFTRKRGGGTKIHVTLYYRLPAGALGSAVARWFGPDPSRQVAEDLERLKEVLDAA